jgi:hypothetical protein
VATVTVVTAERTLEIESTSIVSGSVNESGHLVLVRHDGTPIDVGAVSGMQIYGGTSYSKVDAFTYVGDADPGAVPDGSVWLDTNDLAGPYASEIQKGLVELATSAETISGTDTTRAVTPAGLAAVPGNKVQILASNANTETATPTAYPSGISQMNLTTNSGWSVGAGFGTLTTYKLESDRCYQTLVGTDGGSRGSRMWTRTYHTSVGGGGWTGWSLVSTLLTLASGTITQTTAITSYPNGWSRSYFTSTDSTGWDFAGSAGELLTYVDGTDFAKQTFTKHVGGSSTVSDIWHRTANAANGWSPWRRLLNDPGVWTSYTPTWTTSSGAALPSFGNATISCRYIKIGRKVEVRFEIEFGSTTNFGGGGTADNWQFSLPLTGARSSDSLGFVELNNNSNSAVCLGRARMVTANAFRIGVVSGQVNGSNTNTGDVDSQTPFTWVSGSGIKGHFSYEASSSA